MTAERTDATAAGVLQGVGKALRGHGVVGNVTFAFIAYAAMTGVGVWAGEGAAAATGIKWGAAVFVLYLVGVLFFSYFSPESAAMEGSQLLEWRLATKGAGQLPDEPTSPESGG